MDKKEKQLSSDIERLSLRSEASEALSYYCISRRLFIGTIVVLFSLFFLWSLFGKVPLEVEGLGISLSKEGSFIVRASGSGIVEQVLVKEGDLLQENEPLLKMKMADLTSLLEQIETANFSVQKRQSELALLKVQLATNEDLYRQGLIGKLVVSDTRSQIAEMEIAIEEEGTKLAAFVSQIELLSNLSTEEVQSLIDLSNDSIGIQKAKEYLSFVRSPYKGKVLEVIVSVSQQIDRKESLVWMEKGSGDKLDEAFFITLPADKIGRVRPGMRALIEPKSADPKEYGSILGRVDTVYPYPVSMGEVIQAVGNPQIVSYMMQTSPAMTLVIIKPELDANTVSGFKWTSRKGPNFRLETGTLCKAYVTIEERSPISFLIPVWKLSP